MKPKRFWELDLLRGIAIFMMIAYHIMYDLNFLNVFKIDIYNPAIWFFARSIPIIFIILGGVAITISYERASKRLDEHKLRNKYMKRGLWIFSWGILISIISYILVPRAWIRFGILHFFGVAIILSYPLLKRKGDFLTLSSLVIVIGFILMTSRVNLPWLFWLGFIPTGFRTLDYFPLLPWFGFFLAGIHLGRILYTENKRQFKIKNRSKNIISRLLIFSGRHSLFIYLIHQIVIIGLIYIIFLV